MIEVAPRKILTALVRIFFLSVVNTNLSSAEELGRLVGSVKRKKARKKSTFVCVSGGWLLQADLKLCQTR
jgi:hypothetical protein